MQIEDLSTAVFVGRDININLPESFTGAQLQQLLDQLLPLLRTPGANLAGGVLRAGEQALTLRPSAGDALHQYVQKRSAGDSREALEQHLVRLCLDPDYFRWQSEYVVLSGGYFARPVGLPRNFYARYTVGDGPERKLQKEPLPDVRAAFTTRDPRFQTPGKLILLAQPGAGKTTVLRRLASDLALARLQDPNTHFPFYTSLALQGEAETAYGFLERAWREQLPHAGAEALHELRMNGQLCLLLDGVNEMRTGRRAQRLAEWRQLAQTLPAGSRLAFACRSDDYGSTYLGVQQVEIDPLSPQQIEEYACRVYGDDAKAAAFIDALPATSCLYDPWRRLLAPPAPDDVEQDRQDDADQDHCADGGKQGEVVALDHDVAGEAAKPGQAGAKIEQQARQKEAAAQEHKKFPHVVHGPIIRGRRRFAPARASPQRDDPASPHQFCAQTNARGGESGSGRLFVLIGPVCL